MTLRSAALLLAMNFVASGQREAAPPAYEVASIRPNAEADPRSAFRIERGGALYATGITLKRLLMTAYNVQGFRLIGGPGWVDASRWDVQAKPDRAVSDDQVRPMLRALLEDRFQLHTHPETRNLPVYELVVDRNGPKVPKTGDLQTKPGVRVGAGLIELTNHNAATFASQLSYALAQPVIDRTGLSGNYDFVLRWTPEAREDGGPTTAGLPPGTPTPSTSTTDGPSIFTAIREQLGLRLESARGPVEVVVIDDARRPAAN